MLSKPDDSLNVENTHNNQPRKTKTVKSIHTQSQKPENVKEN